MMAKVPSAVSKYMEEIGRKGGSAKVRKGVGSLSPARRREIAAQGVAARRKRKTKKKAVSQ